jgi:hypothetical protein
MRILLVVALSVFGCSKDEGARPDLSVPNDLSVTHDIAGAFVCDPIKQDCGAGQKCTYTTDPSDNTTLVLTCVAATGSAGFEMPCDRNSAGDPGQDTCAAGFFCSVIGWGGTVANPDRHCNQLCYTTADCPSNHHCIPRTDIAGDCVRDCGALGSTSCGGGLVCSSLYQDIEATMNDGMVFLSCRSPGTGGLADACMADTDCTAGLICDPNEGTCSGILCDDAHPCPDTDAGFSCGTFGASSPIGICQ